MGDFGCWLLHFFAKKEHLSQFGADGLLTFGTSVPQTLSHMKATVDQAHSYQVELNAGQVLLDGQALGWDLQHISGPHWHIRHGHTGYNAEVVSADYENKKFRIALNGHVHEVEVKDRFELMLEAMGMKSSKAAKANDLKAPMPGMIREILVQEGEEVSAGSKLLILEAMKMENVLKAASAGRVKSIRVKPSENVEKGHVLIVFE